MLSSAPWARCRGRGRSSRGSRTAVTMTRGGSPCRAPAGEPGPTSLPGTPVPTAAISAGASEPSSRPPGAPVVVRRPPRSPASHPTRSGAAGPGVTIAPVLTSRSSPLAEAAGRSRRLGGRPAAVGVLVARSGDAQAAGPAAGEEAPQLPRRIAGRARCAADHSKPLTTPGIERRGPVRNPSRQFSPPLRACQPIPNPPSAPRLVLVELDGRCAPLDRPFVGGQHAEQVHTDPTPSTPSRRTAP